MTRADGDAEPKAIARNDTLRQDGAQRFAGYLRWGVLSTLEI